MTALRKLLTIYSKLYFAVACVFGAMILALFLIYFLAWINILLNTNLGLFLLGRSADPEYIFMSNFTNMILLFGCSFFVVILWILNSRILKKLCLFIDAKNNHASVAHLIRILNPVIKYLIGVYLVNTVIFILFNYFPSDHPTYQNSAKFNLIIDTIDHIVPDFGTPLGLILAFIIYLYIKSLRDQEQLQHETDKLTLDSSLTI